MPDLNVHSHLYSKYFNRLKTTSLIHYNMLTYLYNNTLYENYIMTILRIRKEDKSSKDFLIITFNEYTLIVLNEMYYNRH